MSYITPPQLQSIIQKVKDAIPQVEETCFKGEISLDELNANSYGNTPGIRAVIKGKYLFGYAFMFIANLASVVEVFIGSTDSVGEVEAIAASTTSGYGKQPGLSIAVRYKVTLNTLFDKNIVTKSGLSSWHVMPLADYTGFITAQGAGGDSCSCKTWKGTQAQYDAITSKDPDTIYYITEA